MNFLPRIFISGAIVLSSPIAIHAAEPVNAKQEYTRFVKDKDGSAKLDIAIVHFVNSKTGQKVDLVGAVHIGDAAYYQELNERFKAYDAVLYELVKPKDAVVPPPGSEPESGSMLGGLQQMMGNMLDLTFQLEQVDYTPTNFVHADLDVDTFFARMEARGESFLSLYLKMVMAEMQRPQKGPMNNPDVQMGQFLYALTAPDRPRQLKLMLGGQLHDIDDRMAAMEGTVLLTERNDAAMKVLKETLAAGKKNVAVFYGAAHLKGMDATLSNELGFTRGDTTWLTAWDIGPDAVSATKPATKPVE